MNSKYHKLILATAVAASLAGCSKEEAPVTPAENRAPNLTVKDAGSQVELLEGEQVVFTFNAIDAEDDYDALTVQLDDSDAQGSFVLDVSAKTITYTAPVLRDEKSLNDGASVVVRDSKGLLSERVSLSLRVLDENSPVSLAVTPPTSAYGFADTQRPDYVNVMVDETVGTISFTYDISEQDNDDVELDYNVVSDDLVFDNDIVPEMSADNTRLTLTMPIPSIDTPYETFVLTVIATDNDNAVSTSSMVNIINTPALTWRSGNPTVISERDGARFRFNNSESEGYPASYSSSITYADGSELDIELNYRVDSQTGELVIDPVEGFQGDRDVAVSIFMSNVISRDGEEDYVHVTELSQTLTLKDDRDDDYESQVSTFDTQKTWLSNVKFRKDESRVAAALLTHAHLTGRIESPSKTVLMEAVDQALLDEYASLDARVIEIEAKIAAGKPEGEIKADLASFSTALHAVGKDARRLINEWQHTLSDNPLGTLSIATQAKVTVTKRLTAYVGNEAYGYYDDEEKTSWVFAPEYRYLDVVNILDEFCF
jgi:hypothetical protein